MKESMAEEKQAEQEEKSAGLQRELQERTIGYIVGAFGLVAGLAWNDAIKALIEYAVPLQQNTLRLKFLYAAAITVIVVLITAYLTRLMRRNGQ